MAMLDMCKEQQKTMQALLDKTQKEKDDDRGLQTHTLVGSSILSVPKYAYPDRDRATAATSYGKWIVNAKSAINGRFYNGGLQLFQKILDYVDEVKSDHEEDSSVKPDAEKFRLELDLPARRILKVLSPEILSALPHDAYIYAENAAVLSGKEPSCIDGLFEVRLRSAARNWLSLDAQRENIVYSKSLIWT